MTLEEEPTGALNALPVGRTAAGAVLISFGAVIGVPDELPVEVVGATVLPSGVTGFTAGTLTAGAAGFGVLATAGFNAAGLAFGIGTGVATGCT